MTYSVIYDGRCNLCSNLVQLLEKLDQGRQFRYVAMQDQLVLEQWQITPDDCEQGMILIDNDVPVRRWQGSDAAEEIARILPMGEFFIQAYRAVPGLKEVGDLAYVQIRDNRYDWFGSRTDTYQSNYPSDNCRSCNI